MKHHLTFKDDKSDKFWNIEVSENSFTVTYGKTGTSGQTQTKSFDDEKKCLKEAEKLLAEKLKKGYVEVGIEKNDSVNKKEEIVESKNAYLEEWKTLIKAQDLPKALIRHFSYLADTPGYGRVLEGVMKVAISAQINEDCLFIEFPSDTLIATPPANLQHHHEWPESFRKLAAVHGSLELEEARLYLGDHGLVENYYLEKIEWGKTLDDPSKVYSPLVDYSDWWFYHPYTKNPTNEPALCFISHEDLSVADPVEQNAGALFLSRMSEILELYITPSTNENSTETKTSISLKPFLKLSRCVRQGLIHRNDLITLEPKLAETSWEHYPESINRIAIYDIGKPSQPVLKTFLPLELTPYEMCIHRDRLFVFSAGSIEMGTKFNLTVYDITSHDEIILLKELDSELIPSNEKYKLDVVSIASHSSLLITGDYLLFSFESLGYRDLRDFEFKVYNIQTLEYIFTQSIEEGWPNAAQLCDNEVFQYVDNKIRKISITNDTLNTELLQWTQDITRGVYAKKGDFLYLGNESLNIYNEKGQRIGKVKVPGTLESIEKMWNHENILILNHGYFFFINSDGSLVHLKSDWKPKDDVFINDRNKLTFHENKMLVPRLIRDEAPGKEFEFQIFEMILK
ncbi:WGR domain-containing protein [Leptospira santarosai]|uniref:WGR domain-containing protein n=1 Tax=Leptospira santarosai TaxID=28183 RepID=UPI0024AF84B2|nr:WGR domain-containing protein [Leptospira santarosai]MDI7173764.1 WGR domain-containing protein [Leptospira santarosai]MDI7193107.1 WGR domain-containing protein [Leptospira santarosai]MDO6397815.1 WGR domain-containing protein [Leptospira santarosai]MDO6402946.1 WGR domain-containing protein [Leptospira santarosai]